MSKSQNPLHVADRYLLSPHGLGEAELEKTFRKLMRHDIDFADLYFQYQRSEAWSLEEGIVKSGSFDIEQGVGVRAISGEKTAFAYSDDISLDALLSAATATRAIAALGLDPGKFFVPLLPTMIGGAMWVVFTAFLLGRGERKRIGNIQLQSAGNNSYIKEILEDTPHKRPKLAYVNLALVIAVMAALVMGLMHSAILFLIGFVLALMINYPQLDIQKERILAHSGNAMTVVLLVFAAGIFAGIFSGTKMVDALAQTLVDWIPPSWGHLFPVVVAITSMPLTFVLSNDAYYFGVVPILANAAAAYGIDPIEIARASILGQPVHLMSPLVASTLLLVGMVGRDIGDFQKATVKWAVLTSLVVTALALLTGAISLLT